MSRSARRILTGHLVVSLTAIIGTVVLAVLHDINGDAALAAIMGVAGVGGTAATAATARQAPSRLVPASVAAAVVEGASR